MTRRHAWAEDKVPWNTKLIDDTISPNINNYFCQIYNKFFKDYILVNPPIKAKDTPDLTNPLIYIGLKNHNNLFGDYVIKDTTINGAEFIDNTPYNRNCVNQFKLYIMSIIANYKTDKMTLHNLIYDEIKKGADFNLEEVVKILDIPLIVREKPLTPVKPPPVIEAPVKPPLNTLLVDDLFELQIYKEFGVKCTTAGECSKSIAEKFYTLNEGSKLVISNELIRNLYVTIFDYITGGDDLIIAFGNKTSAYITCISKASKALTALNKELDDFVGVRTRVDFNIKKLIIGINSIRKEVNKSINVDSLLYIPEI